MSALIIRYADRRLIGPTAFIGYLCSTEAAKGSDGWSVLIALRGSVTLTTIVAEAAKGSDGWSVLIALRGSVAIFSGPRPRRDQTVGPF